jgi:hypothetical protein
MLLSGKPASNPGGENGKSVFGFFEKGILKLEPGNDSASKVAPSPVVKHRFTAENCDSISTMNIQEKSTFGIGVAQSFGFGDSPRKAPAKPVDEILSCSEVMFGYKNRDIDISPKAGNTVRRISFCGSPASPMRGSTMLFGIFSNSLLHYSAFHYNKRIFPPSLCRHDP